MVTSYLLSLVLAGAASPATPLVGFVVHFDCIADEREARALVAAAATQGAEVVSVVPPAHVWENAKATAMLDAVVDEIARRHLQLAFLRIDASYPPDARGRRENYLYARILTKPGRLPDGRPSADFFLTTAGVPGYVEWMEEETRYYARRYGHLPNLVAISLGPFVEPFASERSGFLQYVEATDRYELTQYTPEMERLWHETLRARWGDVTAVNREYGSAFASIDAVPLPRSDDDPRFGRAPQAYFDLVETINDWFWNAYERCRRTWHEVSGRADVPFVLQFNGLEAEKIAKARPGAAAFDLPGWVAGADAVGLSLYANGGYDDHGHGSIRAVVRLLGLARRLGRPAFVFEAGYEAPNVRADRHELDFLAQVAQPLAPRTWIYEFLKDKFDEQYRANPGKVLRADGRVRREAAAVVQEAFDRARDVTPPAGEPALVVSIDRAALRGDPHCALLAAALFDLAADVPMEWRVDSPPTADPPGVPAVRIDRALDARSALGAALLSVPEPGSEGRKLWACRVLAAIQEISK